MANRSIIAVSCLLAWGGVQGPAAAEPLRDVIAKAVRNHPQIQEAGANRRAVDEELNQARGLYLPRLDLEASSGFAYNNRPGGDIRQDSRWGDVGALDISLYPVRRRLP